MLKTSLKILIKLTYKNMDTQNTFFKDYQNLMLTINTLSKSAENPFFKSKYVELKTVLQEAKRVCIDNHFIFYQFPEVINDKPVLTTVLKHTDGTEIKGSVPIVAKDPTDPQKIAGGITYMRRYSLTAMLGIEEEDDDANVAAESKVERTIDNTPPFENEPRKPYVPKTTVKKSTKVLGEVCPECGVGKIVKNPKTGSLFCDQKCWLKK
jgi:hypothetical protein